VNIVTSQKAHDDNYSFEAASQSVAGTTCCGNQVGQSASHFTVQTSESPRLGPTTYNTTSVALSGSQLGNGSKLSKHRALHKEHKLQQQQH
jgi:hypothetical protein